MSKNFSYYLKDYFTSYLPRQKGASITTQANYYYSFIVLFCYFKEVRNLSSDKIKIDNFSKSLIEDFLNWLEERRKNSIGTRNLRLAAIHSFFRYLINKEEFNYFDLGVNFYFIVYYIFNFILTNNNDYFYYNLLIFNIILSTLFKLSYLNAIKKSTLFSVLKW